MVSVPPASTRLNTGVDEASNDTPEPGNQGWARSRATEPRPYPLCALADAANLTLDAIGIRLGLSGRVLDKLDERGLTRAQAAYAASLVQLEALDVWPTFDESLESFVARHARGGCGLRACQR